MNTSNRWEDRIGRRVKLRDLHIVLAVAQAGGMAKAAERLSISHPVISKVISELEHVLGVRLFDRGVRGVSPTVYGRALVETATKVFDEMRQGVHQIEFLLDPTMGELRFACPEGIAVGLVQAATNKFMHEFPGVILDVVQADTVVSRYRELRDGELEFIVGRLPDPIVGEDLLVLKLFDEPLLVAAGVNSPWTRRRKVKLSDLMQEPWVLPPHDSTPGILGLKLFQASGLPWPQARMVTLSIHLQHALLSDGKHLTLLPNSLVHFGGKRLAIKSVAVRLPPQQSSVGVVALKGRTMSPLAQHFIDCLQVTAAGMAAGRKRRN